MLQTRSYEMCRLSGNFIQWRKSSFDTVLGYNNKNKPLLRCKFGSVYSVMYTLFPSAENNKAEMNIFLKCCYAILPTSHSYYMRKLDICICENKGADQLCSNCTSDQRHYCCYSDSTILLLLIAKLSSI